MKTEFTKEEIAKLYAEVAMCKAQREAREIEQANAVFDDRNNWPTMKRTYTHKGNKI